MPKQTSARLLVALLLLAGLLCLAQQPVRGQIGRLGCAPSASLIYQPCASGFTASCSASSNWLARATNVVLTVDKTNYDNLLCGLNTDGVLAKLDALYIYAAVDQTTALLNLVQNSFNGTSAGTVNFSAYHGFTGDGSTFRIDTGFTASTGGSQFVLNAASLGVYNLTSNTTENAVLIGSDQANGDYISAQPTFSNLNCVINAGTAGVTTLANSQGFLICVRSNATTVGNSKNGAAPTTNTVNSVGLDTTTMTTFVRHDGGAVFTGFTTDQMSAAFIGGALTNTDVSNLSNRINNGYMTAYGINVY